MKRERRQPTRSELASITSRRPVVRRIVDAPNPNAPSRPALKEGVASDNTSRRAEALAEDRGEGALLDGRVLGN